MNRVPTVFISSTKDDLEEYRTATRDAALQSGFLPVMMEYFTASGARPPLEACLNRVHDADLVLVIVAHRYGWVPPEQPVGPAKSVTWLECEHAQSLNKEVIPFVLDASANWPQERREEFRMVKAIQEASATPQLLADVQEAVARLAEFKRWLDTQGLRGLFRAPDDLGRQVAIALHQWREQHPGFGRGEPPATDDRAAMTAYRRELVKTSQFLPLRGLDIDSADPTSGSVRMELVKVYVTLNTTTQVPIREMPSPASTGWWRRFLDRLGLNAGSEDQPQDARMMRGREDTRALTALEAILRERHVTILGPPGSGKSTLLSHLALCLAQHQLEPQFGWMSQLEAWPADEANVVPVTVVLRDFARTLQDGNTTDVDRPDVLWQFIVSRLEAQNLRGAAVAIERALEQGQAMVLFDGLDEIPARVLRVLTRKAVHAFCGRYERSRHIVTCRTLSYQEADVRLEGFSPFELASFEPEQIDAFVGAWYAELLRLGQIDDHAAGAYRDRLRAAARHTDLSRLAPNPLLLTVMALVNTHMGRLPDARAQLYEEIVDILLWRWEARRGDSSVGLKAILREAGRSDSDFKRALWQLAFECHQAGGTHSEDRLADIDERTLLRSLAKLHPQESLDWAWRIVNVMKLRAGLLIERAPGTFTFPHRTFQEYLAGTHLSVQENFIERVVGLAKETALWRPALLLAVGRMIHVTGSIERPLALAAELCPPTLDGSGANEQEVRLVWLAGEVLDEVGASHSAFAIGRDLARRVPSVMANVLSRGLLTPVERAALGRTLANLGDPRFRADAWYLPADPMLGFIEIPAGPFTMGSDPKRDERADADEQPAHPVVLPTFHMARFPVTVAQFRAFAEDKVGNGGFTPGDPDCVRGVANQPIVNVSWHEALAYCDWLTRKLVEWPETPEVLARVLRPTTAGDKSWRVTLASEAEWEKAARGADGRIYPWAGSADPNKANYNSTGIGDTSAVGCFPGGASPYGVEDLSGNVWESTRSLWADWQKPTFIYPYQPGDGREDLAAGDDILRVVRGGAFGNTGGGVRAACRYRRRPAGRGKDVGFRVVVSAFFSEL